MLSALDLVIVVTLAGAERGTHGYDLLQTVRSGHDPAVATTSLYRAIRSLLDRGLIAEAALEDGEDQRRRRYRITDAGLAAAAAERRRLERLFTGAPRLAGAVR
jgi:DNA-binding PadR family transcriptional regulator